MEQFFSQIGVVDIAFFIFVLLGLIRGFMKGFGRELAKNLVLLLSVGTSLVTYEMLAKLLYDNSMIQPTVAEVSTCFAVAFFSGFVFKFIFYVLSRVISFQFVYIVERTIGLLLGGFRYAFLFCFISYLMLLSPSVYLHQFFENAQFVQGLAQQSMPAIKEHTDVLRDRLLVRYGLALDKEPVASGGEPEVVE